MRLSSRLLILVLVAVFTGIDLLHSQVSATVEVKRQQQDSIMDIAVRWSPADEAAWHEQNDGRLDILGLTPNILSSGLPKSNDEVTSYRFSFPTPASVELLIRALMLFPGESIKLLDSQSGRVVFDFSEAHGPTILTPGFDPARTLLEWSAPEGSGYRSSFSVSTIYFQPVDASRGLDIGFGTALPCHPNAVCKEDSMMQLISKSTVRIRLVMEEGIGWCSGSFINNTRNDKTPYLLTAYHCQYDFTPIYDMWRFDFNYTSATCANPATEPLFTSLTGCELMSLGQASDFLLVRLDDLIPFNQDITFAGWNRDDQLKPDTSYLIHHPNADIRKFSTSVNDATIHPNQLSWTEGYTTPAHHHFRLKFTEGGHESGSSGGPLFNEEGLLVGQLHGGTAGCESTNNTYVGRIAKSWNLGSSPQERLRDWLDPDQTNLTQIPSILNKSTGDIVDIHGLVTDPAGRPVKNAIIKVTGALEENLVTGEDGTFILSQVSRSGQYTLTPEKNDHPTNGLNALDLVAIQKHLLGKDTFNLPWKFIAADATNNVDLSVGDILVLLRLMLGKIQSLPSSPSWRFDPPQMVIDPNVQGEPLEAPFMGIKIGDLNGTADPKK